MKSFFVTGTDTDVGKTVICAGLARAIANKGIDIGVMKPFASAESEQSPFRSRDVEILADAAKVSDPDELINPQFFSMPASPYTASKTLKVNVDLDMVMKKFQELQKTHEMMLVEGIGGIMTPILKDYFVADMIRDMRLDAIIIIKSKIGTINHTIMTSKMCKDHGVSVAGIIINDDSDGYNPDELRRDITELTGHKILGIIPKIKSLEISDVSGVISQQIDIDELFRS